MRRLLLRVLLATVALVTGFYLTNFVILAIQWLVLVPNNIELTDAARLRMSAVTAVVIAVVTWLRLRPHSNRDNDGAGAAGTGSQGGLRRS